MRLSWLNRSGVGMGFLTQPALVVPPDLSTNGTAASVFKPSGDWLSARLHRRTILATLLAMALGVFVIAQWQSQVTESSNVAGSRNSSIQQTIDRLEAEQSQLKKQITDLRAQTAAEQQQMSRSQSAVASLSSALATQRALAGTVPLQGNGIEILLDDSTATRLLPSDDPDNYLVHEYQIRDIVNLLWGSGAVGIAVNGERFVNSTSVYCVGTTILINDTRTSPPYHIIAVGDVASIQKALQDSSNLSDLKARVNMYGLVMKVVKVGPFTLPAYDGSVNMKYTVIANGTPG